MIIEKPHFDKEVNDIVLKKGQTAKFRCKPPSTNPSMRISWRKNGRALLENERTSVINQTELVIADVSREDCGEYYCVAKDDELVITSIGTLAVRDGELCNLIRLLFTVYMTLLILTDSSFCGKLYMFICYIQYV